MLSRIVSPPAPKPVRARDLPDGGQRGEPQSPGPLDGSGTCAAQSGCTARPRRRGAPHHRCIEGDSGKETRIGLLMLGDAGPDDDRQHSDSTVLSSTLALQAT
jgi:hypothetical protein